MKAFLCMLLLLYAAEAGAQSFGNGNLVVVRIGSGTTTLTAGPAQRVYLDEYTVCGQLVRSIPLPDTVIGANKRLTLPISTSDYSEGYISRSADGQYLALGGYDATSGTAAVTATTSSSVNRVVAVIDAAGNVNTTTTFSNRFSAVAIRSAIVNGSNIWTTGGSGGIVYAATGSTGTSNTLVATSTGRCFGIYDGQLYATSTATGLRLAKVGTGLPVTTGQTMTNLPGYTATDGSPYQFFMTYSAGSDTVNILYVADNNLLKKYSLVSGSWVANGTIGVSADKYRGLTGVGTGNNIVLYAVRRNDNTSGNGGEVIKLKDTIGYNGSITGLLPEIVVQAGDNKVFRSIVMAPQTSSGRMASKSLTGNLVQKEVQLQWTPAALHQQDYFIVQRSSDNRNYTDIGRVSVTAKQASVNQFTYTDNAPLKDVSFYKVTQVHGEGIKEEFTPIRIKADSMNFRVLFAGQDARPQAELTTFKKLNGIVYVYDVNGKIISTCSATAEQGTYRFPLNMGSAAHGMYIAVLHSTAGDVLNSKFIY